MFQQLIEFFTTHPKTFLVIVIIISLFILIKASDMLLYGVIRYAEKIGLSDYLIGLVVVALTASLPELSSAIIGSLQEDSGIIIGTLLGSNIIGLTFLIGLMALISKKLYLESRLFKGLELLILFATILPLILLIDGTLSRIDALILIFAYLTYLTFLWKKEEKYGKLKKTVKIKHIWKYSLIFILAFATLLLASRFIVFSSIQLARRLNLSTFFISSIILGIGSQMPDLVVSIRSQLKGHKEVGIGDILGSTIVKQLLFFGILALFNPITINFSTILIPSIIFFVAMTLTLFFMHKRHIYWYSGLLMLSLGIAFFVLSYIFS